MNTKNNKLFGTVFNKSRKVRGCLLLTMMLIGVLPANADNNATTKLHVSGRVVESLQLSSLPPTNKETAISIVRLIDDLLTTNQNKADCSSENLCSKLLLTGKNDYHYSFLTSDQKCQSTVNSSKTHGLLNASGKDVITCLRVSEAAQESQSAIMLFDWKTECLKISASITRGIHTISITQFIGRHGLSAWETLPDFTGAYACSLQSVTSLSITSKNEINTNKLNEWIKRVGLNKSFQYINSSDNSFNESFQYLDLRNHSFQEESLIRINLSHSNLSRCRFSFSNLRGARLRKTNLREAELRITNLSGADFTEASLNRADLSGADLTTTNFSGANLSETNLSEVNFSDANLSGANLSGADLSEANLSGAELLETDISFANLRGTILEGKYK